MKYFLLLVIFISLNLKAEMHATFGSGIPLQISNGQQPDDVLTDQVNLNVWIKSKNDLPGVHAVIGYDFRCSGDDPIYVNRDQISQSTDKDVKDLIFSSAKPSAYNIWERSSSVSHECMLNWSAHATGTRKASGLSVNFSITGLNGGVNIAYHREETQPYPYQGRGPKSNPFSVLKPSIISGGTGGGGDGGDSGDCQMDCLRTKPIDPLLIDIGQDGVHLGDKGIGVSFDIMGNGEPINLQWVKENGNEAFLVQDKNGNGIADDGSELFTNFNLLLTENRVAPNGFLDLAQYDLAELGGNDDGFITQADQIWQELSLWLDKNADGISTADEMLTLESTGLTHFYTIPKDNNRWDPAGNRLPLWAWAKNNDIKAHNRYKMVDVFFKAL